MRLYNQLNRWSRRRRRVVAVCRPFAEALREPATAKSESRAANSIEISPGRVSLREELASGPQESDPSIGGLAEGAG
jgi:hypothetical protein